MSVCECFCELVFVCATACVWYLSAFVCVCIYVFGGGWGCV